MDPPGCMIVFTPKRINSLIPSLNGKKASLAAIVLLILFLLNFRAFCIAILQLSSLDG